jgi:hypothetical protein
MVKVNNENEVSAYHVIRLLSAVLLFIYIVTIWLFPEYFSWSANRTVVIVGHTFGALYLVSALFMVLRGGIWFLEFIHKDDSYEFRYYFLTAPFGSKRMIRIPSENLYAFKIKKNFCKLKKTLILYQEQDGKVLRYPPIPLGSLLFEKQQVVIGELKKYAVELT